MFQYTSELLVPHPRAKVFEFFSNALNLEAITPPWLKFHVLTPSPIPMRTGQRIDYKLRIHGFPIRWQSEITAWDPPNRFVDEQRRGPYRLWRHEHTFFDSPDGTLCLDRVDYAVYGGALINHLFVRRDLDQIFAFRRTRILALLSA